MNRINRVTSILIQLQSKKIIPAKEIAQRFNISLCGIKAKQGPLCSALDWCNLYVLLYANQYAFSSHLYVILQRNTGPCLCR